MAYHDTRLQYDPRRATLWRALTRHYFQKFVDPRHTVLELGAGYCDFINNIDAQRKYAVDSWDGIQKYAARDVTAIVGDVSDLTVVADRSVDLVFASNLFEHLRQDEFRAALAVIKAKLKAGGALAILQPNFRFAYREYFDDYTHRTIWTHVSLPDFLSENGFRPEVVQARFLPFSLRSQLPVWEWAIALYLRLPFKPFAKQMLVIARRATSE